MFLEDGSTADFVAATLDPVAKLASLKQGAYHYLLCLNGRYTPESCPLYLTKAGYDELRKNGNQAVSTFRLHTASIMESVRVARPPACRSTAADLTCRSSSASASYAACPTAP